MAGYVSEMGCPFCDIIAGYAFATDFRKHRRVASFVPLNPVTVGHRLFVPVEHSTGLRKDPVLTAHAMFVAADWASKQGHPCNLIISDGREATQTVMHQHVHYVPRYTDDGLHLPWTGQVK